MTQLKLLTAVNYGGIAAKNRLVMAPLTRMRAIAGDCCNPLAKEYYSQRAGAGLIISEATQVSPLGKGYPATPGIYSKDQTQAWAEVVEAVHRRGGKIIAQLWHVGRISHSSFHPEQGLPIAPSAIPPTGRLMGADWKGVDYETPREMTTEDIDQVVVEFKQAAKNALDAGFDGIEIHNANGYLLDQFLQDQSNQRSDAYGGSFENRMRLLNRILEAVGQIYSFDRIGVRLSPYGTFNDVSDSDALGLFSYVVEELNKYQLAYLHLIEPRAGTAGGSDQLNEQAPQTTEIFRKIFKGKLISAGGYSRETAEEALQANVADGIAFGRLYIANPDLDVRFAQNAQLNRYDRSTFYGGAEKGYTDYPSLESA